MKVDLAGCDLTTHHPRSFALTQYSRDQTSLVRRPLRNACYAAYLKILIKVTE